MFRVSVYPIQRVVRVVLARLLCCKCVTRTTPTRLKICRSNKYCSRCAMPCPRAAIHKFLNWRRPVPWTFKPHLIWCLRKTLEQNGLLWSGLTMWVSKENSLDARTTVRILKAHTFRFLFVFCVQLHWTHVHNLLWSWWDTVKNMIEYIKNVHGFQDENITILMDDGEHTPPTKDNILAAYKKLVADSQPGDACFCHYRFVCRRYWTVELSIIVRTISHIIVIFAVDTVARYEMMMAMKRTVTTKHWYPSITIRPDRFEMMVSCF